MLDTMPVEGVAMIPAARSAKRLVPADQERWRAYDEPPEVVFYCSGCAEREFKS
jgi:hypothetical protein